MRWPVLLLAGCFGDDIPPPRIASITPDRAPPGVVVTIDGDPGATELLAVFLERGRRVLGRVRGEIARRAAGLDRGTLATVVYTSGTTEPPKGVLQTHRRQVLPDPASWPHHGDGRVDPRPDGEAEGGGGALSQGD